MDRVPVSSTNIRSIGYDPDESLLEIEFHKGGVYQYLGVPQVEYDQLMGAGSKGSYFHANIKGRFTTQKV